MEIFDNIAISSRIRLARNVRDAKFYTKQSSDEVANEITNKVLSVLEQFEIVNFMQLKNLSLNECNAMFKKHLISKELIENKDIAGVAISEDEHVIVMLNEEDHIREQCIYDGFNLLKPYRRLKKFDDKLISLLDIAFSEEFGFITASVANLGSGMRASVMLFLPALEMAGQVQNIIERASGSGLTVRGIYGEGSSARGSFYQISNQNSYYASESEIIDNVTQFIYEVCQQEFDEREKLQLEKRDFIKDQAYRAYGILSQAHLLEEGEMLTFLSQIKLGAALDFLKITDEKEFQKLYYEGSSSFLKEIFDFSQEKKENIVRAEYISTKIKNLVKRR